MEDAAPDPADTPRASAPVEIAPGIFLENAQSSVRGAREIAPGIFLEDATPEPPTRRRRTEPLDPSSSLLQGLPSQVGAPAADVGMEGPAATPQSEQLNLQDYTSITDRSMQSLAGIAGDDHAIQNTCRFIGTLNRIADLYAQTDDGQSAEALAKASRQMLRLGQRAASALGRGSFRGLRNFDPKAVFVANAKLGMLAIKEMIRFEVLEQAAFAPANMREQVTQEYYQHVAEQNRAMAEIATQTLDRLRHMTWEQVLENGAEIGADMFAQGVFFGAVSKLGGAALGQFAALNGELKTINEVERAAAAAGKATPISEAGQSVAAVGKVAATEGSAVADKTIKIIEENPMLITSQTSVGQVIQEVATEIKDPMGTVWDFIKMTDVMYDNIRIPRSFELTVGNKKFWVHPNATKHMRDYLTKAIEISHDMPINSQTMLKSFKAAVEMATMEGIKFEQIIVVDCWELKFGAARQDGLLPCIFHADFRPRGF